MKQVFAVILSIMLVLLLTACVLHQPAGQDPSAAPSGSGVFSEIIASSKLSDYLTEDDGRLYLILPLSNKKIHVDDRHRQHINDIDLDLLKAAEEKITREVSQYPDTEAYFHLRLDEGILYLAAEYIVDIAPNIPTVGPGETLPDDYPTGGCDIDHEHRFIKERITK